MEHDPADVRRLIEKQIAKIERYAEGNERQAMETTDDEMRRWLCAVAVEFRVRAAKAKRDLADGRDMRAIIDDLLTLAGKLSAAREFADPDMLFLPDDAVSVEIG